MDQRRAGEYDRRLGDLLRRRELSVNEFAVLNRMFWGMRSEGSNRCDVTFRQICNRTSICRDVVNRAIQRGISLGLVRKIKNRVRRAIGAIVRVVNGPNTYVFEIPELDNESEAAETVSQSSTPATSLKARQVINQTAPLDPKNPLEAALIRLGGAGGFRTGADR